MLYALASSCEALTSAGEAWATGMLRSWRSGDRLMLLSVNSTTGSCSTESARLVMVTDGMTFIWGAARLLIKKTTSTMSRATPAPTPAAMPMMALLPPPPLPDLSGDAPVCARHTRNKLLQKPGQAQHAP